MYILYNNTLLFQTLRTSSRSIQAIKSMGVCKSHAIYNSEIQRLRRADVQYTSPPTMLFTIGLNEVSILDIRLKIDLRITQVHEFMLSVANM